MKLKLIEQMRLVAGQCSDMWAEEKFAELIDALERSGALVPVPWGGPVSLRKCWMNHCVYNGLIYRVEIQYGAHCLSSQCVVKPGWGDLVQPVKLVPITEWQIDEN